MTEQGLWTIWIEPDARIVSFRRVDGFSAVHYLSAESYEENIRNMMRSGYRFQ